MIQNAQNYIHLRANATSGLLSIGGRIANTLFGPTTAGTNAAVVGDRLRLEVNGVNWQTYKNGAPVHNGTMTASLTNMRGGFIGRTVTGMIWDNFAHGPL